MGAALRRCSLRLSVRFWVVPHTHWDREWYRPVRALPAAPRSHRGRGDRGPRGRSGSIAASCSTGRPIVLEDYLEIRPEREERLRRPIQAGRIADRPLVHPARRVPRRPRGAPSATCSSAGRSAAVRPADGGRLHARTPSATSPQMPQILRGFGIDTSVFWRGLGDEAGRVGAVFRWRGPDRSVAAGRTPARELRKRRPTRRRRPRHCRPRASRAATERFGRRYEQVGLDDFLLCNGTDHRPIQRAAPGAPRRLRGAAAGRELSHCDDRGVRRGGACRCRPPGNRRGRALRGRRHRHPSRGQLGADVPEAGERGGRTGTLHRRGDRFTRVPPRARVSRRRVARCLAGAPPEPSARLDLRLLPGRGSPRHGSAVRDRPHHRPRRPAHGAERSGRRGAALVAVRAPRETLALVNVLPWSRRRVVELELPESFSRERETRRARRRRNRSGSARGASRRLRRGRGTRRAHCPSPAASGARHRDAAGRGGMRPARQPGDRQRPLPRRDRAERNADRHRPRDRRDGPRPAPTRGPGGPGRRVQLLRPRGRDAVDQP